jgi:hypothetical protein
MALAAGDSGAIDSGAIDSGAIDSTGAVVGATLALPVVLHAARIIPTTRRPAAPRTDRFRCTVCSPVP